MSLIPTSTMKTIERQVEAAMVDHIRLYQKVDDPASGDLYDTKPSNLYDDKCSITDDQVKIARMMQGDQSFEGDALCKMPLISPFDATITYAEVTYSGIGTDGQVTRNARVEVIGRKKTHMRLSLTWTDRGS